MAFELWTKSPMPMVTLVKTFDVTRLVRAGRKRGLKFNMLLCWCIGRAASYIDEFYMLPKDGKMYKFDRLSINIIVYNVNGGISTCDVPYADDLTKFCNDYNALTHECATTCRELTDENAMAIGTSAVTGAELDCIINQYSGIFNNPFLVWGRYRRRWFRCQLPISFQFHHTQMDGLQAGRFLEELQKTINEI